MSAEEHATILQIANAPELAALPPAQIVAHEAHEVENGEHGTALLERAALAERVHATLHKTFLHGDNAVAL